MPLFVNLEYSWTFAMVVLHVGELAIVVQLTVRPSSLGLTEEYPFGCSVGATQQLYASIGF